MTELPEEIEDDSEERFARVLAASSETLPPDPAADVSDAYHAVKRAWQGTTATRRMLQSVNLACRNELPPVGLMFDSGAIAFPASQLSPQLVVALAAEMEKLAVADFHGACDRLVAAAAAMKNSIT